MSSKLLSLGSFCLYPPQSSCRFISFNIVHNMISEILSFSRAFGSSILYSMRDAIYTPSCKSN